jgi:peptidoglycan hydrolase CwlO-like protein
MKNYLVLVLITLGMSFAVPVFAGHDHGGGGGGGGGSHDSSGHVPAPSRGNEQARQAADQILKECSQHMESIQRHIGRLQAQLVDGKAATSAINDDLDRLQQRLKEAKDIARSLRVF